jgi:shikimate kinase
MARIFLIGFMGCGKTTLGRKLAAQLNCKFYDLDQLLEEQAGMSVAEYFSSFGETAFRVAESEILKQTPYAEDSVISTGGGLPCFFDNMQWMNANGKTIYIKLSPKTLASRLENGKDERPLLRDKQGDALVAFITDKLAERESYYMQAQMIADGLSLTAEKIKAML